MLRLILQKKKKIKDRIKNKPENTKRWSNVVFTECYQSDRFRGEFDQQATARHMDSKPWCVTLLTMFDQHLAT
jgi:hypothetical protein